jgi:hypothetical protein
MLPIEADKKPVLPFRKTKDHWYHIEIDYWAVPGYDLASASKGLTEDMIRSEILRDWSVTVGRRVISNYSPKLHRSIEPLEFFPESTLYGAWDFAWGGDSVPAFVPMQINSMGQIQVWPALAPNVGTSIGAYEFCEMVADYLLREFAIPHELELEDLRLVHIGDPSGRARIPRPGEKKNEAVSWYDIMNRGVEVIVGYDDHGDPVVESKKGWKWRCIPGAVNITTRLEALRSRLSLILPGGWPGFVLDNRAESIHTALMGGYCYEEYSDGSYSRNPKKNRDSDIIDALCYGLTRLFAQPKVDDNNEEDEDTVRRQPIRSHAAGRHW